MIIDATNTIMGRLATRVAKLLLKGEKVEVVNIEKTVFSGDPKQIVERYRARRGMQNKSDPEKSAKWPRRPDYLFKRILRGMLPKNRTGEIVLHNFIAHVGVPSELADKKIERIETKEATALDCRHITLLQVSKQLGWNSL
ncbi:TPA: 50S ribosomal protein L13 [Candidatus Micrarchaeota archaeon]|nr:MAG: 50S ribosomal protein L13 [Candidatus Micrarchaeota archaeon CG1_02_51_15]HII38988.1 50S ribosomal protein L13 [Candidatus Micrarchaeota archaeon]